MEDRPTALLIEDDQATRLLCRVNLELEGYRVLEAATGQDADEYLARNYVDVVVLDLRLGDEDGADIGARIRAANPELRILVVTGRTDSAGRADRLRFADAIIIKPFEVADLLAAVRG